MSLFDKFPRYRSYLLTLWEERNQESDAPGVWRFSLKDPHTDRRRGFGSLEALVAALEREIAGKDTDEKEEI